MSMESISLDAVRYLLLQGGNSCSMRKIFCRRTCHERTAAEEYNNCDHNTDHRKKVVVYLLSCKMSKVLSLLDSYTSRRGKWTQFCKYKDKGKGCNNVVQAEAVVVFSDDIKFAKDLSRRQNPVAEQST